MRADAAYTREAAEAADWPAAHYASLDSTSREARRLIAGGLRERRLITADSQTDGECRHSGRLWESAPGRSILASFIMPVSVPPEMLPQASLVFAVAVREGIAGATGVRLAAKWPNDLMAGDEKCCGLLAECWRGGDGGDMLILGAGVNVSQGKDDFPPYLRDTATSLALLANGRAFCRDAILRQVGAAVSRWFALWQTAGFAPARAAWLAANRTLGSRIILPEGYGYSHGTAHDLDETGALVVLADDGAALRIDSGEIRFSRERETAAA